MTSLPVNRGRWSPQRWRAVVTAALLAAALAGCSSTAPDLATEAAQKLQAKVLTVSQSAAGNDHASALKSLDELVAELDASAAEGSVSFKRHQSITKAIEAVRADLTAARVQAEADAATAKEAAAAAAKAEADAAAAKAAAEEAAKQAPAPVLPPAQDNSGSGNKGKGKGDD